MPEEFEMGVLLLLFENTQKKLRESESALRARGRELRRLGLIPKSAFDYRELKRKVKALETELDQIAARLKDSGVNVSFTRTTTPADARRIAERAKERHMLEGMMRGNYHRYDGEDM